MHSIATSSDASRRDLGLLVLAACLWGTVGVTTQALYGLAETSPISIGFFRLVLALPVLIAGYWHQLGHRAAFPRTRDLAVIALMGSLLALYQVCYFAAIRRAGVSIAALVTLCTAPILVAVWSAAVAGERPTRTTLLALGCALLGTSLLIAPGDGPNAGDGVLLGVLLALCSAGGYAAVTLCGRALAGRCHPLQVTVISFAIGALLLAGAASPAGMAVHYPVRGWVLLVYLGVVPTALAYGVFLAGMRSTPATVASIVTLLEPLVATGLAWLLFEERLGPFGALGALLLLTAMGMLYRGRQAPR